MTGCSVQGCRNRSEAEVSLHRFPADLTRKVLWARRCGHGPEWTPPPSGRICQVHFPLTEWKVPYKRLRREAMPSSFCLCTNEDKENNSTITSPISNLLHDHPYAKKLIYHQCYCPLHSSASDSSIKFKEEVQKKSTEDTMYQAEEFFSDYRKLKRIAVRLHKELNKTKEFAGNFSEVQRAVADSLVSRGRKWPDQDVVTALTVGFAGGPSTLKAMSVRSNVAPLPSMRTVQRRIQHLKFQPGILNEVLDSFKPIVEQYHPLDKDCCLSFDDMSIVAKRDLDPSTGTYIGDVTLPGVEGLATKATAYMLGGCRARWKIVAGYHFVPEEVTPDVQAQVVKDVISAASGIDLNVIAVVCDMGNRGITNALGFSTKKNCRKFSIPHPSDPSKPLFLLPDCIHLYKSLKESLVSNKSFSIDSDIVKEFNLPSDSVLIEHIEWLDDHQSDMNFLFAPQLSSKHIKASHFNKMKSSSARSVLNHKVACALKYKVLKGEASKECGTTAWFIDVVNKWFDLVTNRGLTLALSKKNLKAYDSAINHLKLVVRLFSHLKIPGGWKPIQTHLITATEALLEVQDYLLNVRGYNFVYCGRFLQDMVENMFSQIRTRRPNPTALQFKQTLRHIVVAKISQKVKGAGYSFNDDREDPINYLLKPSQKPADNSPSVENFPTIPFWQEPPTCVPIFFKNQEDIMYRMCGYVLFRLIKRGTIKCNGCISALSHQGSVPHPNDLWVRLTNYRENSQLFVSDDVFQLLRRVEYNLMLWEDILIELKTAVSPLILSHFKPHISSTPISTCHDVTEIIVKYYVEMRLKQLTVKLTGRLLVQSQSHLSSKSMGSRFLSDRFTTPQAKLKTVNKKLKLDFIPTTESEKPMSMSSLPEGETPSSSTKSSSNTMNLRAEVSVQVKTPTVNCPSLKRKKTMSGPGPSESFKAKVSNKLGAFHFSNSTDNSLKRLLL